MQVLFAYQVINQRKRVIGCFMIETLVVSNSASIANRVGFGSFHHC